MRFLKHLVRLLNEFIGFAWHNKAWWIVPVVFSAFDDGLANRPGANYGTVYLHVVLIGFMPRHKADSFDLCVLASTI